MKLVFGSGEAFKSELLDIPWISVFLPSKILVAGIDGKGNVVAVCGIRSMFNILTLYVCEEWRSRGIGSQILEKTIDLARERRLRFVLLGVFWNNTRAIHLYSKLRFKEIVYLKKPGLGIMMLPIDFVGEAAYVFFCGITSLLPNVFWAYVAQWIHDRTISDDECN